jgi:pimeloyl-ACP methyl ester carboxylesterase
MLPAGDRGDQPYGGEIMPYMTADDGVKIWYDVEGKGEPLVLIGGSSLVHRQWDFMRPLLADAYRLILYDQRGAGLSDRGSKGVSVEQWTDDLRRILDEIGVARAHIFSTSNGSLIAVRFAAKYPERTRAIIHYGVYRFTEQYRKMSRIGETIAEEFGFGNGGRGAYFWARMFGMPSLYEPWLVHRFEENLTTEGWKAMHKALDVDLTKDLGIIKAPQLMIIADGGPIGKESDYASGSREIQNLLPGTEMAVIHGAEGTFHVITHPAEVVKEALTFLKKQPSTGE